MAHNGNNHSRKFTRRKLQEERKPSITHKNYIKRILTEQELDEELDFYLTNVNVEGETEWLERQNKM